MAESVGALRVDLSANSAQFGRDLQTARDHLSKTGDSFQMVSGVAGESGEKLTQGLKRGVRDFAGFGEAMSEAGGKAARFGGELAEIALGGFNPLALAIAGAGIALGVWIDKTREATKEQQKLRDEIKSSGEALTKMRDEYNDLVNRTDTAKEVDLRRRLEAARQQRIDAKDPETARLADERAFQLGQELDLLMKSNALKAERAAKEKTLAATGKAMSDAAAANNKLVADSVIAYDEAKKKLDAQTAAQKASTAAMQANADAIVAARNAGIVERAAAYRQEQADRKRDLQSVIDALKGEEDAHKAFRAERDKDLASAAAFAKLQSKAADELDAANAKRMTRSGGPMEPPPTKTFTTEIVAMREEMKKTDALGVAMAHRLTEGLSNDVAGAFTDALMGAKSFGAAMKDMTRAVVADLIRMTIQAFVFKAIMSSLGFVGASPTPGGTPGGASPPTGSNISMGPTKSAMLPRVEVHNYSKSAEVSVAPSPDGKSLKLMIADAVADDVAAGGKSWQAIRDAAGLQRVPRRRA